ncbi:hypothetical protein BJY16_004808 [Actinoplanes octamycinicus]|uniref:Uncharacterized protein n=1 Tax=Actinoplanes octamycinicus TaxID=135948 RepID=A0A7W7M8W7_9ACTN|nr:hypothetical protein [Actinoplanes octamycinicus]MBB4741349.1 hypothetical protein [Actinoplanes octamycinicus]GIE62851.1 hypothetical protein Aoc01nite_82530 [Actinoplanes octamycinicus]
MKKLVTALTALLAGTASIAVAAPAQAAEDRNIRVASTFGSGYGCTRMVHFAVYHRSVADYVLIGGVASNAGPLRRVSNPEYANGRTTFDFCPSYGEYGRRTVKVTIVYNWQTPYLSTDWNTVPVDFGVAPPTTAPKLTLSATARGRVISGKFVDPRWKDRGYNIVYAKLGGKTVKHVFTATDDTYSITVTKPGTYEIKGVSVLPDRSAKTTTVRVK